MHLITALAFVGWTGLSTLVAPASSLPTRNVTPESGDDVCIERFNKAFRAPPSYQANYTYCTNFFGNEDLGEHLCSSMITEFSNTTSPPDEEKKRAECIKLAGKAHRIAEKFEERYSACWRLWNVYWQAYNNGPRTLHAISFHVGPTCSIDEEFSEQEAGDLGLWDLDWLRWQYPGDYKLPVLNTTQPPDITPDYKALKAFINRTYREIEEMGRQNRTAFDYPRQMEAIEKIKDFRRRQRKESLKHSNITIIDQRNSTEALRKAVKDAFSVILDLVRHRNVTLAEALNRTHHVTGSDDHKLNQTFDHAGKMEMSEEDYKHVAHSAGGNQTLKPRKDRSTVELSEEEKWAVDHQPEFIGDKIFGNFFGEQHTDKFFPDVLIGWSYVASSLSDHVCKLFTNDDCDRLLVGVDLDGDEQEPLTEDDWKFW